MRKKNPVSDGESYCPKDVRGDEEILVRDINHFGTLGIKKPFNFETKFVSNI